MLGSAESVTELMAADQRLVWHPYAGMPNPVASLPVESAHGVRLRLADGRELIDGMASWWCAVHGYRHPVLDGAVRDQLDRMAHVMFGGLTHEPAIRLATRLVESTPAPLEHVFFSDSGSVSVEVAIKMCLQYWRGKGQPHRRRLMTVRGGYHGDTFGAMAVCDPYGGMHALFTGTLAQHVFADRPPAGFDAPVDPGYEQHLTDVFERHAEELAAVIVEPVVQGAGGMHFYSPGVLVLLRELCDRHGVLLVFDEIASGFGRTGAWLACDHAGIAPDVICLGKALSGGYITLAATLCTTEVARMISRGGGGALMHGPTFMANPLACAVSLASLELLESRGWREDVARIEGALVEGLGPAGNVPGVRDVRVLGAIGVVQLDRPVDIALATHAATELGVWLRPFRDLIYTMPPYITDEDDLACIAAAVVAAASASLRQ